MASHLDLVQEVSDGRTFLTPFVDGTSLVDLVTAYETERGYDPAGGYGGLALSSFDLALPDPPDDPSRTWLLGCDCGETACWPLTAAVEVSGETVSWSGFEQPSRPSWDYEGFGPFRFDLTQYDETVQAAGRLRRAP